MEKYKINEQEAKEVKEMIDLAESSSKLSKEDAVKIYGIENVQEGYYTCPVCQKRVPLDNIQREYSNVVKDFIIDSTCKECRKSLVKEKACRIVCIGCKEVFCYMPPSKNKVTGFEMKPGETYHILQCPKCNSEIKSTNIIESEIYVQKFGKGTKNV